MRTDDDRIKEVEEQIVDLRKRLLEVEDPSDASKLSNSLSQAQHMLTGIEHLKLQRTKYAKGGADLSDDELEEQAMAWLRKRGKISPAKVG